MDLVRAHDLFQSPKTLRPCPQEWVTDVVDPEPEVFSEADPRFAQRTVGEQLWLAMRCRADIHYIVSYMASWVGKHPLRVTRMALRVLSYLHKTAEMRMILGQPKDEQYKLMSGNSSGSSRPANNKHRVDGYFGDLKLVGYSDASFAPFGDKSYGASLVTVEDSRV